MGSASKRYAEIPSKYLSFNLLVEIGAPNEETYVDTFLPIAEAIRTYNKDRVVFAYGNVGEVFDGLAAYGYPLAWSIFYPDMYTQIGFRNDHPLYDHVWKDWFLNGCIGYSAEGPKKVEIQLDTDVVSATLYLCNTMSYVWDPIKNPSPASFSILADGSLLMRETLKDNTDWQKYTVNVPRGTTTLTLTAEEDGYLTFDGIILTPKNGTQIKIIPTTYDFPRKSVPEASVTVASDGTVTSDVPMTFDLLLAQNDLYAYIEIAKKNNVGMIIAEWAPVSSERINADALDYYALFAKGFRDLGITAAPSRSQGMSFSLLILGKDIPAEEIIKPDRYVPVGDGSDYYIDTWEYKALTGKSYEK